MAEYAPEKKYKWEPTDSFTLKGEEFAVVLNTLRGEVMEPTGAPMYAKVHAYNILESLLAKGVTDGYVTEAPGGENSPMIDSSIVEGIPLP